MNLPPKIAPEKLFQSLLVLPYPTLPINFKLDGCSLKVRAISSSTLTQALEIGDAGVIAATVLGHPILNSTEDILDYLLASECKELLNQIYQALNIISPCYGYSNIKSWNKELIKGINHSSQIVKAQMLGQCYDLMGTFSETRMIERPDRYFGVPFNELIDCHLIAYRAARVWHEEAQHKSQEKK